MSARPTSMSTRVFIILGLHVAAWGAFAQTTTRVSLGPSGEQMNDASFGASLSADGRLVAFSTFVHEVFWVRNAPTMTSKRDCAGHQCCAPQRPARAS